MSSRSQIAEGKACQEAESFQNEQSTTAAEPAKKVLSGLTTLAKDERKLVMRLPMMFCLIQKILGALCLIKLTLEPRPTQNCQEELTLRQKRLYHSVAPAVNYTKFLSRTQFHFECTLQALTKLKNYNNFLITRAQH